MSPSCLNPHRRDLHHETGWRGCRGGLQHRRWLSAPAESTGVLGAADGAVTGVRAGELASWREAYRRRLRLCADRLRSQRVVHRSGRPGPLIRIGRRRFDRRQRLFRRRLGNAAVARRGCRVCGGLRGGARTAGASHRVAEAKEHGADQHEAKENAQQGTRSQGNFGVVAGAGSRGLAARTVARFVLVSCSCSVSNRNDIGGASVG